MKYVNPYMRKEAGVKDWWDNLSQEEKETLKRTGIGAGAGGVGGLALAALTGRKKKGLDALAHYAGFGLGGAGIGGLAGYGYDRYKKGKDRAAAEVAQLEEERRKLQEELDNARKKPEKKGPTNARERRHANQQAIRDRIAAIDAEIKKLSEQHAAGNAGGAYDAEGNFRGDYSEGEAHFRKNKGVRRKTNKYGDESYEALIAGDTIDDKGNSKFYADLTRDPETAALDEVRKQQADYDKEYKDRYYKHGVSKLRLSAQHQQQLAELQKHLGMHGTIDRDNIVFDPNDRTARVNALLRDKEDGPVTQVLPYVFHDVDFDNPTASSIKADIAYYKKMEDLARNMKTMHEAAASGKAGIKEDLESMHNAYRALQNATTNNSLTQYFFDRAAIEALHKAPIGSAAALNALNKQIAAHGKAQADAERRLENFKNSALAGVGRTVDKNDSRFKALYDKYTAAKTDIEKKLRGYGDLYAGQSQAERARKATADQRKAQQAIRALYAEKEQLQGQLDNKLQRVWYNLPGTAAAQEFLDAGSELYDDTIDTLSDGVVSLYR